MRFVPISLLAALACNHPARMSPSTANAQAAPTTASAPAGMNAQLATSARSTPPIPSTQNQPAPALMAHSATTYPLVVSFGSVCCGTDHQASNALERLLSGYKPEALGRSEFSWGEEGEYDLCFSLTRLSEAQRRELVRSVKANIRSKLVTIRENIECNGSAWAASQ